MRPKLALIAAGLAIVGLVGCTSVPPVGEIPAEIANAKTAADHQRIAAYFAQKAASYDAEAAQHEEMARSYVGGPRREQHMPAMAVHCRSLRDQFVVAAREARALEQAHRQLATGAAE